MQLIIMMINLNQNKTKNQINSIIRIIYSKKTRNKIEMKSNLTFINMKKHKKTKKYQRKH
jgi:hypothetical protein